MAESHPCGGCQDKHEDAAVKMEFAAGGRFGLIA